MSDANILDFLALRSARRPAQRVSDEQIIASHVDRALSEFPENVRAEAVARAERSLGAALSMEEAKRRAIAWARCAHHPNETSRGVG